MKILVTGAAGMLGRDLTPLLATRHETVALDLPELDLTDPTAVTAVLAAQRPAWVVNCAAYTAVDRAEQDAERAAAVNSYGPGNLACACACVGARLLHLSTDYVFDGRRPAPYRPDDPPHPLSVYGLTKLGGETAVREALGDQALIVRTAWLYGPHGPNFVAAILRQIDAGNPLRVVADQRGAPTYTAHLAPALLAAIDADLRGLHHATNAGDCTWYEFAAAICAGIGRPDYPLAPLTTAEIDRPAPRPANSVLDRSSFEAGAHWLMPSWQDGLRAYLDRIGRLAPSS